MIQYAQSHSPFRPKSGNVFPPQQLPIRTPTIIAKPHPPMIPTFHHPQIPVPILTNPMQRPITTHAPHLNIQPPHLRPFITNIHQVVPHHHPTILTSPPVSSKFISDSPSIVQQNIIVNETPATNIEVATTNVEPIVQPTIQPIIQPAFEPIVEPFRNPFVSPESSAMNYGAVTTNSNLISYDQPQQPLPINPDNLPSVIQGSQLKP